MQKLETTIRRLCATFSLPSNCFIPALSMRGTTFPTPDVFICYRRCWESRSSCMIRSCKRDLWLFPTIIVDNIERRSEEAVLCSYNLIYKSCISSHSTQRAVNCYFSWLLCTFSVRVLHTFDLNGHRDDNEYSSLCHTAQMRAM